ncbi:MAG: hypothetical protein ACXU9B_09715 [Reyranella sp.]
MLAVVSGAGLASGCATIATGGSQAIHIQSQPPDAQCTLTREGKTLGSLLTPGDITVSLSRHPIRVSCRKTDYQDTAELLVARGEALSLLDLHLVASAIDYASGAYVKYPTDLKVWLVPSGSRADLANVPPGMAAAPSPLDGRYFGTLRSFVLPSTFAPVQIDLQIVSGRGSGTVKTDACADPGDATVTVDSAGAVVGRFQLKDDKCQGSAMTFTGLIKDGRMKIKIVKGMEGILAKLP